MFGTKHRMGLARSSLSHTFQRRLLCENCLWLKLSGLSFESVAKNLDCVGPARRLAQAANWAL